MSIIKSTPANNSKSWLLRISGFSYIEVLLAILLIAIALGPAIEALQTGINGSRIHTISMMQHYYLTSHMETVLAEPYTALSAAAGLPTVPSSYSDAPATPNRRLVYIAYYDIDNLDGDNDSFTGTEPDMLWIKVQLEGTHTSYTSLCSEYD